MHSRLLQVLPSVIRQTNSDLELDADFCDGLRLYLDNFEIVTVACSITTDLFNSGLRRCRPLKELPWRQRLKIIPLPHAYHPRDFLKYYRSVSSILRAEILESDYLVASPHSLFGDWPTVAIREAVKLNKPYTLDADVVYEEVARVGWTDEPSWKRFVKENVVLPLFRRAYRRSLRESRLALLQGQDVYDAYSGFAPNAHKVYHMPISSKDYISDSELEEKVSNLNGRRPLKLCYVGRAIEMKGPLDWLKVVRELHHRGVEIVASWFGDGSLLSQMRQEADTTGIANIVKFVGYVSNREEIMAALKGSDIFLFCHKTPESPRCLIEALVSGCPLIGYASAYPKELTAQFGGGRYTAIGDWRGLADHIAGLDKNRNELRDLIVSASKTGRLYEQDATMQQRIDLIKQYCGYGRRL